GHAGIVSLAGSPVRAKVAQVFDTRSASAWARGLWCASPITWSVSKTNGTSTECGDFNHPPKAGVSQSKLYTQTGAPPAAALRSARSTERTPKLDAVSAVISRSDGLA